MHLRNTPSTYGAIAIAFHWLVAIVIICMFGVGLWMTSLSYYSPRYHEAPHLHKSVGILLAAVMVARLVWRL
ncbi:MAG: cytochrome b, partial [Enterobacteriaceae bacterium]